MAWAPRDYCRLVQNITIIIDVNLSTLSKLPPDRHIWACAMLACDDAIRFEVKFPTIARLNALRAIERASRAGTRVVLAFVDAGNANRGYATFSTINPHRYLLLQHRAQIYRNHNTDNDRRVRCDRSIWHPPASITVSPTVVAPVLR